MKQFDAGHPDSNNVGDTVEPTALAHTGNTKIFPTCASDITADMFNDIIQELVNAIEGAGLTLDGANRSQLLGAINAKVDAAVDSDSNSFKVKGKKMAWYTGATIAGPLSESQDVTQSIAISGFDTVDTVIVSNVNVADLETQRAYFTLRSFTTSSVELRFQILHTYSASMEAAARILVIGDPTP